MVRLNLTREECVALKGILEREAGELHRELANTDNWKLKESLRLRQALVEKLLKKVEAAQDDGPTSNQIRM